MSARLLSIIGVVALAAGCGGGSGHATGTGGSGSGGAGTGGSSGGGSGGTQATGGNQSTGGAAGSNGTGGEHAKTGGSQASGGSPGTGGSQANGGAAGGSAPGTGGAAGGVAGASGGGQGGTSLSTSDPNVAAVIVDTGPEGSFYINGPFATITLCEPGTTNCQTIDHMLIDTGSTGIRVLESVVKLKLPEATSSAGKKLAQCLPFMSGSSWGPVVSADFKIAGESASKMRIQLIGELTYPMDSGCSGTPITDLDTLGSNGILGVGIDVQDCGSACAKTGASNPGLYYECTSNTAGGCATAAVAIADQIGNPVAAFATDNNGSFFRFPTIPAEGAPSVDGFLVFGIGTRPNNGLGSAKVMALDSYGFSTTVYPAGGTKYRSFIDSGSNGLYFLDSTTSKLSTCKSGNWNGFYCPSATTDFATTMTAKDGSAVPATFSISNASKFLLTNCAFSTLGAPMMDSGSSISIGFDFGWPFYYGRTVFTAIAGRDTPGGTGPYFAF
jgi:hypothetical protein